MPTAPKSSMHAAVVKSFEAPPRYERFASPGQVSDVIYESKVDDEGEYEFLRTYWHATKNERKKYGAR